VKFTVALQSPASLLLTMGTTGQVMFGASQSLTLTLKVQELCTPPPSVTVQVTGVMPTGKLAAPVNETGLPFMSLVVQESVLLSQRPPSVVIVMLGLR
jgi:hypothetical protein